RSRNGRGSVVSGCRTDGGRDELAARHADRELLTVDADAGEGGLGARSRRVEAVAELARVTRGERLAPAVRSSTEVRAVDRRTTRSEERRVGRECRVQRQQQRRSE